MRIHRLLAATILFSLLASCSEPSPQPDLPEVEQEIAPIQPDEDITLPTAFPEDTIHDTCLEGAWSMDTSYLDILVNSLVPVTNLFVPHGSLNFHFYPDGRFTYAGDLTLQFNFAENWFMQGVGSFIDLGTYATEDDLILFNFESTTASVYQWNAYKDGQAVETQGGEPEFTLTPPGRAPYRCTPETLEIDTLNPTMDTITMFFSR